MTQRQVHFRTRGRLSSENPEPTNPTPSPAEPAPPLPPFSQLPATVPDGQQPGKAPVEPAPLATPGGSEPAGEPAETSVSALQAIPPAANLPEANPPEVRSKPAPIQISSVHLRTISSQPGVWTFCRSRLYRELYRNLPEIYSEKPPDSALSINVMRLNRPIPGSCFPASSSALLTHKSR